MVSPVTVEGPRKGTSAGVSDVCPKWLWRVFTACVPFQVKPLFLLPLITQSGSITLYLSILFYLLHTQYKKEVPVSLLEQCSLQASGPAQVSQKSDEMVNKLGFVMCISR